MQRPDEDTAPTADPQGDFTGWAKGRDRALAERAVGFPTGAGAASDAGAWSVTRPPVNTESITPPPLFPPSLPQILLTGTDTLDAGLYIEFPDTFPRLIRTLSKWKAKASGTKGYVAGNGRCIVHPGGKTNYPFLLQYPGFMLYLSRHIRPFGQTPNAKLILGSQLLWERGERSAFDHAIHELQALADAVPSEVRFSRADITADLLIPGGLSDSFLREFGVKRSRKTKIFFDNDRMQSYYVGSAESPIQLRVYDKSAEISHSGKVWFLDLWGITINVDVWRIEFQLRRPALKSLGLNSLDDWMKFRGTLWNYLTGEWFSLRLHDDENASRRTVHPLWDTVQACTSRFDEANVTLHRQRPVPSSDISHLMKQLAGGLVGLGARRGVIDLAEAKKLLVAELDREFRGRDFTAACQQKSIELGLDGRREAA